MIIGTKIEFENHADFILRDYLGVKYDSFIPFDVQAFAEDYLKLEISYTSSNKNKISKDCVQATRSYWTTD